MFSLSRFRLVSQAENPVSRSPKTGFVMTWPKQGQLLEGVECHIYLYCFTFDDINLNRAFVIIVLFPKKYSNKKVCANDKRKRNALGIY